MNEPTELELEQCKAETEAHRHAVASNIGMFIKELLDRSETHDLSKLESPELEGYAQLSSKLKDLTYGSDEYKKNLAELKPVIEHHYANNRHHPEFHKEGVDDMDLIDIIEMLADWSAATQRNKNGNLRRSLELNKERFKLSIQLTKILENTIQRYF